MHGPLQSLHQPLQQSIVPFNEDPQRSAPPDPKRDIDPRAIWSVPQMKAHGIVEASMADTEFPLPPNEIPDGWLFRKST
jgi:hypothetical protein